MIMTRLFVGHLHTSYLHIPPMLHTKKSHSLSKQIHLFQHCMVSALGPPSCLGLYLNSMIAAPTHVAAMLGLMPTFRNAHSVTKIDSERTENHGNDSPTYQLSHD